MANFIREWRELPLGIMVFSSKLGRVFGRASCKFYHVPYTMQEGTLITDTETMVLSKESPCDNDKLSQVTTLISIINSHPHISINHSGILKIEDSEGKSIIANYVAPDFPEIHGSWEVTQLLDVSFHEKFKRTDNSVAIRKTPSFNIYYNRFSGYDGCNTFRGSIIKFGAQLEFKKGLSTLLGCDPVNTNAQPTDVIFNEAMTQNPNFVKIGDRSYDIVWDKSPQLRDWRIAEDGQLEILKDGVVVLRAKRQSPSE